MNPFASNLEKAKKALEAAISRVTLANAELEAHRLAPADPGDFAQVKDKKAKDALLIDDLEVAGGVVKHWEGVVAKLQDEADQKAAVAKAAELERTAAASVKRVRAIFDLQAKLKAEVEWLAQHVADIDDYNAARGDLPFVVDAETRVRYQPAVQRIERPLMEAQWFDANGFPASQALIASGNAIKKRVEIGVIHDGPAAREAHMPPRFADAITLVDLSGNQIWPLR